MKRVIGMSLLLVLVSDALAKNLRPLIQADDDDDHRNILELGEEVDMLVNDPDDPDFAVHSRVQQAPPVPELGPWSDQEATAPLSIPARDVDDVAGEIGTFGNDKGPSGQNGNQQEKNEDGRGGHAKDVFKRMRRQYRGYYESDGWGLNGHGGVDSEVRSPF